MKTNELIELICSFTSSEIEICSSMRSEDELRQASINSLVNIDMKFHYFKIRNLIMRKNQQIEILSLKLKHARARIVLLESRLKKFNTKVLIVTSEPVFFCFILGLFYPFIH